MLPCAGSETIEIAVVTPLICELRLIVDVVLNNTVTALSDTVGAGGAATVSASVAGAEVPPGPVAVKLKLSPPTYPDRGAYVTTFPTTETMVPFAGEVATAMLLNNPDICVVRSITLGVLNTTAAVPFITVGAGAEVTEIVTVATPELPPGPVAR